MANFQAKEWLKSAYSDIQSIHYIVKDPFLTHVVAFHSQQAIEKCLKAVIENEENRIPKVHKLQYLIAIVDIQIDFNVEMIEVLDELYIESRYPGDLGLLPEGKPSLENAKDFDDFSKYIFEEVCMALNITTDDLV